MRWVLVANLARRRRSLSSLGYAWATAICVEPHEAEQDLRQPAEAIQNKTHGYRIVMSIAETGKDHTPLMRQYQRVGANRSK